MFSFGIIAENFEVFENDIFDCKVLWMVGEEVRSLFACGDSGVRVATFSEKTGRFPCTCC